jgi:predicted RNA-binding Zn-ribbon protein involved in translation (DUF1610 family)
MNNKPSKTNPEIQQGESGDTFKCPKCGNEETWFDRTLDENNKMHERCTKCGESLETLFPEPSKPTICKKCGKETDGQPFHTCSGEPSTQPSVENTVEKTYPLWSQFIHRKSDWIGRKLQDFGDSLDRSIGCEPVTTEITDITLEPSGEDSACFSVVGKDFTCAFGVKYGGVTSGENGWITFAGYGGHTWRIESPNKNNSAPS